MLNCKNALADLLNCKNALADLLNYKNALADWLNYKNVFAVFREKINFIIENHPAILVFREKINFIIENHPAILVFRGLNSHDSCCQLELKPKQLRFLLPIGIKTKTVAIPSANWN